MKTREISKVLGGAALSAVVGMVSFAPATPVLADINIGALACQAPYLAQAARLRWHEHYLINPQDSMTTWVVCPIAFESNDLPNDLIGTDPSSFFVGAMGNRRSSAGGFHVCYVNVVDLRNQHIPLDDFIDNEGQQLFYQKRMQTREVTGQTLWWSEASLTQSEVVNAMDNPPFGGDGAAWWTITVNCKLPTGYALNMVSIYPTL